MGGKESGGQSGPKQQEFSGSEVHKTFCSSSKCESIRACEIVFFASTTKVLEHTMIATIVTQFASNSAPT